MGRKIDKRVKKQFFDPMLGILGGGHVRYIDAMHRSASKMIALEKLTQRIRTPVNSAGVERISDNAIIYGIYNTNICRKVTLETLTTRMGVAKAILPYTQEPKDRISGKDMYRARKFTEIHQWILKRPNGPFHV
jgi:hypothetical protein